MARRDKGAHIINTQKQTKNAWSVDSFLSASPERSVAVSINYFAEFLLTNEKSYANQPITSRQKPTKNATTYLYNNLVAGIPLSQWNAVSNFLIIKRYTLVFEDSTYQFEDSTYQ